MAEHDHGYKLLFSHPEVVADLLRGHVREPWVARLDLSTLERVDGSYVSDDLREREDDIVWRVRWGDGWVYVYLLLEFQATVDRYMAVRILTYLGLLYQDLIRAGETTPDGLLPPVLPLVLYNGEPRWTAPTEIADLIHPVPGGLEVYKPQLRYLLLDEGRLADAELPETRDLAAAVFRFEASRAWEDVQAVLRRLLAWLHAPEQRDLRRSFAVWLGRVVLPGLTGENREPAVNDLYEVDTMLAERIERWKREYQEQGYHEGMQQGMQQGEAALLLRQMERKFGPEASEMYRRRVEQADAETLLAWSERLLAAETPEQIFT